MKTRPVVVAAHNVFGSPAEPRATQLTFPPPRSAPYVQPGCVPVTHVRRPPEPAGPSFTQSPQVIVPS